MTANLRVRTGVFACALLFSMVAAPSLAEARPVHPAVPNPGTSNALFGVSTLSPTSAWAVGDFYDGTVVKTLILRWNGSTWKHVPSPSPGDPNASYLEAVSADSTHDAWAVGWYSGGTGANTIALHWTGAGWSQVTTPNPGVTTTTLSGVTAISPTNAWAVGDFFDGTALRTLILHWDGVSWSQVASPNAPGDSFLRAVDATSATDIWAVGDSTSGSVTSSLALHYDGVDWTQVASPSPSGFDDEFYAVTVGSDSTAWAVGNAGSHTLILRWNGRKWKRTPSPNPGGRGGSSLSGVDFVSSTDAWAVGSYFTGSATVTLILRWNGATWEQVPGPNPDADMNFLFAVGSDSSTDVWAAGWDGTYDQSKNLLEHWNGIEWTAS